MTVPIAHVLSLFFALLFYAVGTPAAVQIFENASSKPLAPAMMAIESAHRSLDIEIYEMEDPQIRLALRQALKRGVKVRVIHEPASVGKSCRPAAPEAPEDTPICRDLKRLRDEIRAQGGVFQVYAKDRLCPVDPVKRRSCLMHGKMILVDGAKVWLSTGNFNATSLCHADDAKDRCNKDYTLSETRPLAVLALLRSFEADLAGQSRGDPAARVPDLTVSPFAEPKMLGLVRSARASLWIENQYLKHEPFNAAIRDAAMRGVDVYLTLSDPCAFGRPSLPEIARFRGSMEAFEGAGVSIRIFPLTQRVGGQPGYLHAKAVVVDGNTAWVGSINGSESAFLSNREFGLIFRDLNAVRQLSKWMLENHQHPRALSWQAALRCQEFGVNAR